MTYVKLTLHVDAQGEPPDIHQPPADRPDCYAVSVALRATEIAGADPVLAEGEAKAAIEAFLASLRQDGAKFYLVQRAQDGSAKLDDLTGFALFAPTGPAPDLAKWLADAGKAVARPEAPFYRAVDARETADFATVDAFDLQRAAARWPAPVAQNSGLLAGFSVPADDARRAIVFLPPNLDPTSVVFGAGGDETVLALSIPWPGDAMIDADCAVLKRFDATSLPDNFQPDGWIKPDVFTNGPSSATPTQALAALLGRIEEAAATGLWAFPEMQLLLEDPAKLAGLDPDGWRWLLQSAALAAFDLPLLALRQPKADAMQRPRLIALLVEKIAQELPGADVDRGRVHAAIQTLLGVATAEALASSLASVGDFAVVKDALEGTPPSDGKWAERAGELHAALGELARRFEDENVLEAWIVAHLQDRLFGVPHEHRQLEPAVRLVEALPAGPVDSAEAIRKGFTAFKGALADRVNAAAVMRADVGATIARLVRGSDLDPADIIKRLAQADGFVRRFARGSEQPLDPLFACLPIAAGSMPTTVNDALKQDWGPRVDAIGTPPEAEYPFRADRTPQPLYLPQAAASGEGRIVNPASTRPDSTVYISGVAYLIGVGDDDLCQASLLRLSYPPAGGDADVRIDPTVDPTLPVGGDNPSGPVLPYAGAPLSSPNLDVPSGGAAGGILPDQLRPFKVADATYAADRFPQLPALAYGKSYRIAAYWVPPSGVLPAAARDGGPFAPKGKVPHGAATASDPIPYRRRTAIGDMTLRRTDAGPAIGKISDDVHPLALEAPRIVLTADGRRRDLFQRTDGSGLLRKSASGPNRVRLEHVAGGAMVAAELFGAKGMPLGRAPVTRPEEGVLEIDYGGVADGADSDGLWLRLTVPGAGTALMTCADPAGVDGEGASPRPAPVLLLAPEAAGWRIPAVAELRLDLPRVSFTDFERWCRNQGLMEDSLRLGKPAADPLFAGIRKARSVLVATEGAGLDSLPDPAVTQLYVTLTVSDACREIVPETRSKTFEVAPYQDLHPPTLDQGGTGLLDTARDFVEGIDRRGSLDVEVKVGPLALAFTPAPPKAKDAPTTTLGKLSLAVPEGTVARLWVSPGVPAVDFR